MLELSGREQADLGGNASIEILKIQILSSEDRGYKNYC